MHLAYVAGIVDGEGCIQFGRSGRHRGIVPRLLVVNTNLPLLKSLQKAYGGDISPLHRTNSRWKTAYSWRLSHSKAVALVSRLEPWLRIKSEQANLLFAWDEIRPGSGGRWSRDGLDAAELIIRQSKWLNWRGLGRSAKSPVDEVLEEMDAADEKGEQNSNSDEERVRDEKGDQCVLCFD